MASIAAGLSRYTPSAMPLEQAREFIHRMLPSPRQRETVRIDQALASDVTSTLLVLSCDKSAVDGYAIRSADLRDQEPTQLRIVAYQDEMQDDC